METFALNPLQVPSAEPEVSLSPCSCRHLAFLLCGKGFVLPELLVPWNCTVAWRENHEWGVIP